MLLHVDLHLQPFKSPECVPSLDAKEASRQLELASLPAHSGILAQLKDLPPGSSYYIVPLFLIEQIPTRLTASLLSELFSLLFTIVMELAAAQPGSEQLLLCRRLTALHFQA